MTVLVGGLKIIVEQVQEISFVKINVIFWSGFCMIHSHRWQQEASCVSRPSSSMRELVVSAHLALEYLPPLAAHTCRAVELVLFVILVVTLALSLEKEFVL